MPVSVSALSALEQAAQLAGKPVFLGANALRSYVTAAEWSTALTWASGASGGATNQTRAGSPPRWVHDGRLSARSRPNAANVSTYYLLFEIDGSIPIDAVVLAHHNFVDIPDCEVRLGLADDSSYLTFRRTIASWSNIGDARRLVALDLTDNGAHGAGEFRRFTDAQYAYLEVVTSGVFTPTTPRIGEIFLGRGRRLARAHDYPGDDEALESRVDDHEADGGDVARFVRHRGRRVLDVAWTADSEDELGDDLATWRALFENDLEDGTLPAFYVRDPAQPQNAPLLVLDPVQRFDYRGPHHAQREIAGREVPPFVRSEVPSAVVASPPTPPATLAAMLTNSHNQNVVFRSGQSLALGTNGTPALTTAVRYPANTRPGLVWPWTSAVEGAGTGGVGSDNEYGGVSLVNQLRSLGPSDRHYAVRTVALSGQRLDQIDVGSTVFENLYGLTGSQLAAAFNGANGAGEPVEVAAAVLIQGEADGRDGTALATYRDLVVAYQADVQSRCQTVTSQTRPVPLFLDQFHSWTQDDVAQTDVVLAQLAAADAQPELIFVVGPKYQLEHSVDGVHLANTGYRQMGELQGRAMDRVLRQGLAWVPLRATGASATGSTIRVPMNVPEGPLAFDTTTVTEAWTSRQAAASLYGFELIDPGPQPVQLTGATIDGDDIVLTTSGPVRTGSSIAYARTGVHGTPANPQRAFSPKGNLRDSAGDAVTGIESGERLDNWCVTFEEAITGGVAPPSAYAQILDDISWDALWTAQDVPAGTTDWVDRAGSLDAAHASGAGHTLGQSTGGAPSGVIGSGNVNAAVVLGTSHWATARTTVLDKAAHHDLWVRFLVYLDRSATTTLCRFQGDTGPTNNWYVEARSSGALYTSIATQGANLANGFAGAVPSTPTLSLVDVYWQAERPDGNAGSLVRICVNGTEGGVSTSGSFGAVEDGVLHLFGDLTGSEKPPLAVIGMGVAVGEKARNQAFGTHGGPGELNAAHFALL